MYKLYVILAFIYFITVFFSFIVFFFFFILIFGLFFFFFFFFVYHYICVSYFSQYSNYYTAINYLATVPKYRIQAQEIARQEGLIESQSSKKHRGKKTINKQEEEAILKRIVERNLDMKGGYRKPSKYRKAFSSCLSFLFFEITSKVFFKIMLMFFQAISHINQKSKVCFPLHFFFYFHMT